MVGTVNGSMPMMRRALPMEERVWSETANLTRSYGARTRRRRVVSRGHQGGDVPGRTAGDEAVARGGRHVGEVREQAQHLVLGGEGAGGEEP
ncbi:hypothetical protein AB0R11_08485 [Streptomyces fradiae]|uniref:hypothetical protein n=1 Tax=Streptomyces fradiae TaxID=1906 RepID=UPI0034025DE7